MPASRDLPPGLLAYVRRLFPDASSVQGEVLGPDAAGRANEKTAGYGQPMRITVMQGGRALSIVFHTALPNEFGHNRRADRADEMILAWDTMRGFPRHARVLDMGVLTAGGECRSLADAGEFFLVTEWADGVPYAEDLRRIGATGECTPLDEDRCEALAKYLAGIHSARKNDPLVYRRAVRDLLGSGEGIFGITDAYGTDTPSAPPERLAAIEHRCLDWRWRLHGRTDRLARTHGDFHPFNVVFREETEFTVLDASRGCAGDPADDVAAMVINYVFFAMESPQSWLDGLGPLWFRFWDTYLKLSGDRAVLDVVAPFLAWRGLVVACPRFYPHLSVEARDNLLGFVERTVASEVFDPRSADELLR